MSDIKNFIIIPFILFLSCGEPEKNVDIPQDIYDKEQRVIERIQSKYGNAKIYKDDNGLVCDIYIDSLRNGEVPVDLQLFDSLKMLMLYDGEISELPEWISKLPLKSIYLPNNRFNQFPDQLLNMTLLEVIVLNDNPISSVNETLNFPKLKQFWMPGTKITKFPIIKQEPNSPSIDFHLAETPIDSIPDEISSMRIKKIWMTDCNQLTYITPNLGKQDSLEELNFRFFASPGTGVFNPNSKPKTVPVPKEIAHCKNLKSLNLGHNKLTAIPDYVFEIESLENLELWDNQISEIPEKIVKLQKLKDIYLPNNNLKTFPRSFGQMPNLETISVWGNAISKENLPVEMFDINREKKCALLLYMSNDKSYEGLPVSQEQFERGYRWYGRQY
ncbi:leucine-rich repeat domain-containing protein [Persicobacter psychrovividus]|uniref:Membrane protein n=1 Tax=Persicobacter psychrovividus TaxID=387638 RepID=A0ABM7VK29_9BACT|nr:membrane protein [Persicobacter psychrovividus]